MLDKIGETVTPRFLVYDIVRLAGRDVREEFFFPHRLDYIKNDVIGTMLNRHKSPSIGRTIKYKHKLSSQVHASLP